MTRTIRKHLKDFIAIIALVVIALAVGLYILHEQRLRLPWESAPTEYKAEFTTAQAVTPGQGQTVRVSGIKVGDIGGVDLKDGHAVVTLDIDDKYRNIIHTDATALLRPKTGLKDMFIELDPGTAARAKPGFTIPITNTEPDVNLDEVFSVLDSDTRGYLQLLVNGAGAGLKGRGGDLAEVFRRLGPTHRDLARVAGAIASRRHNLRRLVSSLAVLNAELADKRMQLTALVNSGSIALHSFADQNQAISRAVADLPGTLHQTTLTLGKVRTLATVLKPAAADLIPVARAIPGANKSLTSLAKATEPIIRTQIRPFVRAARPVVRSLSPTAVNLAKATPDLTGSFVTLNHLFNTLGYNELGSSVWNPASSKVPGFLFWIAWLDHNAVTLFSSQDANGGWRPLFLDLSCSTIQQLVTEQGAAFEFLANLTPILTTAGFCG